MLPCLIFEDDHLLVVNKPAGMNTHAPAPHAGEGLYDWLRHREPRWARLAIIHRLDKETSGVIVFAKSELARRSLTEQFTCRTVRKKYLLLTDRPVRCQDLTVRSALVRVGEKYVARPAHAGGEVAETRFRIIGSNDGRTVVEAEPLTGKTHQIRVHAAAKGFPILGDLLYAGTRAARVHLHAGEVTLSHPASGQQATFAAPAIFSTNARLSLRSALIDVAETNGYRLLHGASDGWPGWYVDRLGDFLLSQSDQELGEQQREKLADLLNSFSLRGAHHKNLTRAGGKSGAARTSPRPVLGEGAPAEFAILENGLRFALSFREGYSVGLFLDQRENRRRFLTGYVAPGFLIRAGARVNPPPPPPGEGSRPVNADGRFPNRQRSGVERCVDVPPHPLAGMEILNAFAYTCGFSVCAAKAGARTTSLDLSKKYLQWGKRNFALNGLNTAGHDFVYGDVFDWLRRFAKRGRRFDVIVLDPPTFSQSKEQGVFQADKDYPRLVTAALPLLEPEGVLFASTNAAKFEPETFLDRLTSALTRGGRRIVRRHYTPQPPDFPICSAEPAYLKTVWLQVA